MNRVLFLSIMGLGVVLEVAGDILFKKWADGGSRIWLVAGFIIYSLGSIGWAWSLKYESLGKAVVIFMLANVVLAVVAGRIVFGERMNPWNWAGVALAIAAIIMSEVR